MDFNPLAGLERLFAIIMCILMVAIPLALWKLAELMWAAFHHISVSIK